MNNVIMEQPVLSRYPNVSTNQELIPQRRIVRDQKYPDLLLDIHPCGSQTWYFIFRDSLGSLQNQCIGDASKITRDQARSKVDELTLDLALRHDLFPQELETAQKTLGFHTFVQDHYLPFAKSYKRSWATDLSYLKNHHLPYFKDQSIQALERADIIAFKNHLLEKNLAPGTINRCLVLLRYLFNLVLKWDIAGIEKNPTKDVPLVPNTRKIERYLSEEETQRLFQAIALSENPLLKDIIACLLFTGARKREILDARWEHVLWDRQVLLVPLPKGGKPRYIPLSAQVLDLLKRVRARQLDLFETAPPERGWIFPNPKTQKPFVSLFNAWDTARRRAGLDDLRMHDLRHSFASFLVNHGRSLYEVQRILGHTQIRTTQRYAHLSQDTLLEAVNMAGELLESQGFAPKTELKKPVGVPVEEQNRDELDLSGDTHDDNTH